MHINEVIDKLQLKTYSFFFPFSQKNKIWNLKKWNDCCALNTDANERENDCCPLFIDSGKQRRK